MSPLRKAGFVSYSSLAAESASNTGMPSILKISATVDLPLPIPPVRAKIFIGKLFFFDQTFNLIRV